MTSGRPMEGPASAGPTRGARGVVAILAMPFVWLAAEARLLACPICFQVEENATTDGVQMAVVVLMGVTLGVLGGFGACVARFIRRSR